MNARRLVLTVAAAVLAGAPVLGACAEAFPLYNMDMYCRDLSAGDFAKNAKCGEEEAGAYAKLQSTWASIPEKRKVECHNVAYDPNTGKGSYALHLQCIEKGRK